MDGYVTIGTKLDTKSFDAQITQLEKKLEMLEKSADESDMPKQFRRSAEEARELNAEIEKTRNKLNDMYKKQAQIDKVDFSGVKGSLNDVGNSVGKVIKKVAKWGLAVFGIRSAYLFVRQAMSTLTQYDSQLATDVDYIRYALASAIKPIIEAIINLVYKLMAYVAYIAKAWFGISLFANATAKGFQNANKGAKALQKTLAGFDEMNVLNQDGSVGIGGGTPSMDLSNLEDVKIPGWVEWIAKNKDLVLGFFATLATIIVGIKIAHFLSSLSEISSILAGMSGLQIFGMLAGIAITIVGIYETITSIIQWLQDPTWDNFVGILDGLSTTLIGIGITMVALNASNPLGWIAIGVGAIGKFISALSDNESHLLSTKEATKQLKDAQEELAKATDDYVSAVDRAENAEKALKEAEEKHNISGKELFNLVSHGKLNYKDMNDAQKEVYKAYLSNEGAQKNLKKTTKELEKANKEATLASLEKKRALAEESGNYDKLKKAIIEAVDEEKISVSEAREVILKAMSQMDEKTQKTFAEDMPASIMKAFDEGEYKGKMFQFEKFWNSFIDGLNKNIDVNVTATYSTKGKSKGHAKGALYYPKLAVGGIINQPGSGVPYHGATIGERGAEAVVPLTDSQQMELLGETIGRYITVNLTNITKLDGRQIARKVDKVNQNNDFVFNR